MYGNYEEAGKLLAMQQYLLLSSLNEQCQINHQLLQTQCNIDSFTSHKQLSSD
jgi:hypothetical protein